MNYYYEPYKTTISGFNTLFSLEQLKTRLERDEILDDEEQTFINYLKIKGQF